VAFFVDLVFGVVGIAASLGTDLASTLVADDCFKDGDGHDVTFGRVHDAGKGGGGGGTELIPAAASWTAKQLIMKHSMLEQCWKMLPSI